MERVNVQSPSGYFWRSSFHRRSQTAVILAELFIENNSWETPKFVVSDTANWFALKGLKRNWWEQFVFKSEVCSLVLTHLVVSHPDMDSTFFFQLINLRLQPLLPWDTWADATFLPWFLKYWLGKPTQIRCCFLADKNAVLLDQTSIWFDRLINCRSILWDKTSSCIS